MKCKHYTKRPEMTMRKQKTQKKAKKKGSKDQEQKQTAGSTWQHKHLAASKNI